MFQKTADFILVDLSVDFILGDPDEDIMDRGACIPERVHTIHSTDCHASKEHGGRAPSKQRGMRALNLKTFSKGPRPRSQERAPDDRAEPLLNSDHLSSREGALQKSDALTQQPTERLRTASVFDPMLGPDLSPRPSGRDSSRSLQRPPVPKLSKLRAESDFDPALNPDMTPRFKDPRLNPDLSSREKESSRENDSQQEAGATPLQEHMNSFASFDPRFVPDGSPMIASSPAPSLRRGRQWAKLRRISSRKANNDESPETKSLLLESNPPLDTSPLQYPLEYSPLPQEQPLHRIRGLRQMNNRSSDFDPMLNPDISPEERASLLELARTSLTEAMPLTGEAVARFGQRVQTWRSSDFDPNTNPDVVQEDVPVCLEEQHMPQQPLNRSRTVSPVSARSSAVALNPPSPAQLPHHGGPSASSPPKASPEIERLLSETGPLFQAGFARALANRCDEQQAFEIACDAVRFATRNGTLPKGLLPREHGEKPITSEKLPPAPSALPPPPPPVGEAPPLQRDHHLLQAQPAPSTGHPRTGCESGAPPPPPWTPPRIRRTPLPPDPPSWTPPKFRRGLESASGDAPSHPIDLLEDPDEGPELIAYIPRQVVTVCVDGYISSVDYRRQNAIREKLAQELAVEMCPKHIHFKPISTDTKLATEIATRRCLVRVNVDRKGFAHFSSEAFRSEGVFPPGHERPSDDTPAAAPTSPTSSTGVSQPQASCSKHVADVAVAALRHAKGLPPAELVALTTVQAFARRLLCRRAYLRARSTFGSLASPTAAQTAREYATLNATPNSTNRKPDKDAQPCSEAIIRSRYWPSIDTTDIEIDIPELRLLVLILPAPAAHVLFQLCQLKQPPTALANVRARCCKLGDDVVRLDEGPNIEESVQSLFGEAILASEQASRDRLEAEAKAAVLSQYAIAMAERLAHSESGVRLEAVEALRKMPVDLLSQHASALVPRLEDSHGYIRRATVEALGRMPAEVQLQHGDTLAARLGDSRGYVRFAAVEALALMPIELQSRHSVVIAEHMEDSNAGVRQASIEMIGQLPMEVAAGFMDAVVARLDDPNSFVRRAVVETLGSKSADEQSTYAPAVVTHLRHSEAYVRKVALEALTRMSLQIKVQYQGAIAARLEDVDEDVRQAAGEAAESLRVQHADTQVVPPHSSAARATQPMDTGRSERTAAADQLLLEGALPAGADARDLQLGRKCGDIREAAMTALARMPREVQMQYAATLAARLEDPDTSVRRAVVRALAHVPPDILSLHGPSIVRRLEDPDTQVRRGAAKTLGHVSAQGLSQDVGKMTAQLMENSAWGVRQVAVSAVGRMPAHVQAKYVGAVVTRLEDEDADVRQAAVKALRRMPAEVLSNHASSVALLVKHDDAGVRHAAVKAVGRMPLELRSAHVGLLATRLEDTDTDVRREAVRWLARMQKESSLPPSGLEPQGSQSPESHSPYVKEVLSRLHHSEAFVRQASIAALGRMPTHTLSGCALEVAVCLMDINPGVRKAAVDVLGHLPVAIQSPHVGNVVSLLEHNDVQTRQATIDVLGQVRADVLKDHVGALVALRQHSQAHVRRAAADVLKLVPTEVQAQYAGILLTSGSSKHLRMRRRASSVMKFIPRPLKNSHSRSRVISRSEEETGSYC